MKILTIGVGAFGLAVLKHLSTNHKNKIFYAYEKDEKSMDFMIKNKKNPYFFVGEKIEENVKFIKNLDEILPTIDLIIIAIPNQFVKNFIKEIKNHLKPGVSFLNLSKGIDNQNLKTVSDNLNEELGDFKYSYNVLSGGMIASELFYKKNLGAQIGYSNKIFAILLKDLFENKNLKIDLNANYKNIELFGALKNVLAIYVGYLEGQKQEFSSIGFHFCELFKDIEKLVVDLGGKENFDFSQYSLGGDIIATCFGNSRNRYLGKLVGSGKSILEALEILKSENKHSEGFETLKGIREFIKNKDGYEELKKVIKIFL